MKKVYVTPEVEKVEFKYRDQVVASSGINAHKCTIVRTHTDDIVDCSKNSYWESKKQ